MLESMCYEDNAFVTLTYNEENLPENNSLKPEDLRDWQKRLRYYANIDLRFFSVGEYGEKGNRPHYHAAVFGFKGCASYNVKCGCVFCETLRASWKKGFVLNGTLSKDSAQYIAGYVTKKMTDRNPEEKYRKLLAKGKADIAEKYKKRVIDQLNGRHPEFARMSNRPGIGAPALSMIREMLETEHGADMLAELQDAPDIIKIGGKDMLLGKYLKSKLRKEIGVPDEVSKEKLSQLRKEAIIEYITYAAQEQPLKRKSQKDYLIAKNLQKVRNIEKRFSNNKNKGIL